MPWLLLLYVAFALCCLLGSDYLVTMGPQAWRMPDAEKLGLRALADLFVVAASIALALLLWSRATQGPRGGDAQAARALNELSFGVAVIDRNGIIEYANPCFVEMTASRGAEVLHHAAEDVIASHFQGVDAGAILPKFGPAERKVRYRGRDGLMVETVLRTVRLVDDATPTGWVMTTADVTQVEQLRRAVAINLGALEVASDGVAVVDISLPDQPITYVNRAFHDITGYAAESVIGRNCRFLQGSDRRQPEVTALRDAIAHSKPYTGTLRNYRQDGTMFLNEIRLQPVLGEAGVATHYVSTQRDVTRIREMTVELDRAARHDTLTTISNRNGFRSALSALLERRGSSEIAVIKLNVAGFHELNTTFGYTAGDALLIQIAERLKAVPDSVAGRLDADGFAIAVEIPPGGQAAAIVDALRADLSATFVLPGVSLRPAFYIGYAVGSAVDGIGTLMRRAAAALHEARQARARLPHLYTGDLEREISRRIRLTTDLQQAISGEELLIHYQAKVDLATGHVAGAEGLLRWEHPVFGLQLPGRFISTAEHTGLIVPIGEWVMREVANFAVAVNQRRAVPYRFAVNVSQIQFRQADMLAVVERVLEETGASPSWLTIELTESLFAGESVALTDILRQLRALGVGLSIDDFGTGYSSLRYLGAFPVTEIKIDRVFVKEMLHSHAKRAVVEAVIRLGHAVGADVVAEGIEQEAERRLLRELGCGYGQGNFFSVPIAEDDFIWLANNADSLPMPHRAIEPVAGA